MKILIAVITCHHMRARANAQRETWVPDVHGADVRFFLGRPASISPAERPATSIQPHPVVPAADEIFLDVPDDYKGLPAKVQAMWKWAHDNGYEFGLKLDDDVYLQPGRALASGFEKHDYVGRLRGASGIYPAPYASGFSYWLSRKAMKIIADTSLNGDVAEDRFVGNALHAKGISCHADYRYVVVSSTRNSRSGTEGPRRNNFVISATEFNPESMRIIHHQWLTLESTDRNLSLPKGTLDRVSVLIKTFWRDGFLHRTLAALQANFPEVQIIIIDDGQETRQKIAAYAELRKRGHVCSWLPFDSGFGAKANEALKHLTRPYLLIGSDDFDFSPNTVRDGVEKLLKVLDGDRSLALASGRVADRPYEAILEEGPGWARETAGYKSAQMVNGVAYHPCDLTVNYSLMRASILGLAQGKIHWDGDVKIGGGEHGAFFIDLKRAGHKVAYVPGVSIKEQPYSPAMMNPGYPEKRARARANGRPCFKRRGIDTFYLMGGTAEVC